MPGKKKFIDKKNAVSFHLVHRSQRDPLQADEDAPQRVLLPLDGASEEATAEARKQEERKYGVYFDDDYDYLQHMKETRELHDVEPAESFRLVKPETKAKEPSLNLPSDVFGSTIETDVGMLNKAAPISGPRLDWDPDVVAAMDEDFDFDDPSNELEDDFMMKANAEGENDEFEDKDDQDISDNEGQTFGPFRPRPAQGEDQDIPSDEADSGDGDFEGSDIGSLGEHSFGEMDTKSRFTEYSMTSSVMRRTEGLTLLDDRFEKLYEQYDDEDIGALDHEEIDGFLKKDSHVLNAAIEEFEKQQEQKKLATGVEETRKMAQKYLSDDEDDEEDLVKMTIRDTKDKWDCESILSTHSTLYNHPKLITEPKKVKPIKLTKRAGIPEDSLPQRGLTVKQIQELSEAGHHGDRANTYRPKHESTEDKKERKQAIKEERRARRQDKKANKMAFKAEKIRQSKDNILNVQQNKAVTIT